ncbi:MAG TPA: ankyrin repeat domain-containing protein [Streptosporangiaceae bacterium]|jgi:ankyrin repeat protein
MADLPASPSLDHLRRQARDLLRAVQAGDTTAVGRIRAVSGAPTLASAQLAVAREYGFASWTRLKDEVTARTASLAQLAEAFCEASIGDGTGRAARMLAAAPGLARYSFATAVILGDADRVRTDLGRDPGLAARPDARSGWTPLHAVSASRWHQLDPARAGGLLSVALMLLDAGADPNGRTGEQGGHGGWTPLRCAVAGAASPAMVSLLLRRGAVPGDHDLYLAGFADDNHECLRLLLFHAADVAQLARMALAAPISINDSEGVHLLLEAGADPDRYADDAVPPSPVVYAAVRAGCSAELTGLLLGYGANPDTPGPDGRSPYVLAVTRGRTAVAMQLRQNGADVTITGTGRLLAACQDADRAKAERLLARDPGLPGRIPAAQQAAALIHAAETGNIAAITLMLDLGFPVDGRGDDGGTALHAAAYSGSAPAVRLLLDRGAGIEARDTSWDSTPVEWAAIGSGEQPASDPRPDWAGAVQALLDAGASARDITLSPDDPKPPSAEVAALLRRHGVPAQHDERL